jgi:hypothetical protein
LGDSQEVFQENAETLLDFVSYGLENDLPEFMESGNVEDLSSETLDRFGDMMNASEQFLSAKRLLVYSFTEAVFLQSYSQNTPSQEAEQQAKEDSREFVRNYFGSGEVSEEQREAEGRCLISALSGNVSSVEEFFQSHPLFGEEAVAELYQKGILTE